MPARRAPWVWLGVGAVVVLGAAIAAAIALREAPSEPRHAGSDGGARDAAIGPAPGSGSTAASTDPAARLVASAAASAAGGRFTEALADYQRAFALDGNPSTLFELGRMEYLAGRCRDARRTTQRVLAASPGEALAAQAQQLLDRIGRCD